MRTLTRLSLHLSLLAFVAGPLLAACGDNNTPGGGDDIDAGDDEPPDADTSVDADTSPSVSSTVAVFDTRLTDPSAAANPPNGVGGVAGGTIRMSFNNLREGGGTEVFRGGPGAPIQSCLITKYDATHLPNPRLDAGEITVSAPATGANALLKTVGPCTLQAPFGDPDPYICLSHEATGATVGAQDLNSLPGLAGSGAVAYTLALPAVNFGMRAPVTISSATRNPGGTAVTVVTTTPHAFLAGQFVTIAGVTPAGFNTTTGAPIAVVLSPTSFVYGQGGTGAEAATAFGTATVPTYAIVGSTLSINGLANPAFNSGASAFPIVNQLSANTVVVINSAPANDAAQAPAATGVYKVLNGFSPIPSGNSGLADFLAGSPAPGVTGSIRIEKAANANWPAMDYTIDVPGQARQPVALATVARASDVVTATTTAAHEFIVGQVLTIAGVADTSFNTTTATVATVPTTTTFTYAQVAAAANSTGGTAVKPGGFTLDGVSAQPHTFPTTTAADQRYSCDNNTIAPAPNFLADDTCGDDSTAPLRAMILSGSATKKSVAGLFPFQMPTEVPGTDEWLEWSCAFIAGKSAIMPTEAVQAILAFGPTRIEQQILFVGGDLIDGPGTNNTDTGRVLAGHAVAGHTTFCPAAAVIPAATITNVSRTGNVVTVTTAGKHNFFQTQLVTIAGVTPASFNATGVAITSTPVTNGASTTFTYAQTDVDVATTASAGTATVPTALTGFGPAVPVCPP